jgi:hypothetical protein
MHIDPTAKTDQNCKTYVEKEIVKEIHEYQYREGIESFSRTGRQLWIIALELVCQPDLLHELRRRIREKGRTCAF